MSLLELPNTSSCQDCGLRSHGQTGSYCEREVLVLYRKRDEASKVRELGVIARFRYNDLKSGCRKRGLDEDCLRSHLLEGRLWPVSATLPRYCEIMSNEPSADKLHKTSGRNRIGGWEVSGRLFPSRDCMRILAAIRREEEKCKVELPSIYLGYGHATFNRVH